MTSDMIDPAGDEGDGIRALRGRVRFEGDADALVELDRWSMSAGRNDWMTPETLARHGDARSAGEIEAVARAICREEAGPPKGDADAVAWRRWIEEGWPEYQNQARAAIRALRALDVENNRVPE